MNISDETIIYNLNSIDEHKMAKEIFAPLLKKMGLEGVRYTGGMNESGIDIEYYELTQPDNHISYVGIQFKQGDIVYGTGGNKNTVINLKNQADEAFNKEIPDYNSAAVYFIERFVVATTGIINEKAREMINKARAKGQDRRINYWDKEMLIQYIRKFWMNEFINYFGIDKKDNIKQTVNETSVIDSEYIEENYKDLLKNCLQVKKMLSSYEFEFLCTIAYLAASNENSHASVSDVLFELGRTEEYYQDEIRKLVGYNFLDFDCGEVYIRGRAGCLLDLANAIFNELTDAEEDTDNALSIFEESLGK